MNRRESIGLIGTGALGMAALSPAVGARSKPALLDLDPANPDHLALIHRKLAWATRDTVGYWWLKGIRYAAVPPTYTPFWNMLIAKIFKVQDIDADTYAVTSISTTFYTDLKTGALLETFNNPITGKVNQIRYPEPKVTVERFGRKGELNLPSIPGSTVTHNSEPGPAWIVGDDVWVRSDMAFRAVPDDLTRKAFQVEDFSTYWGSLKEVANPKIGAVATGQVFTDVLNFPPWLEMGDRNGHYFSRCFGRKVFRQEDMPAEWQRLVAERYPDLSRNAAAMLSG